MGIVDPAIEKIEQLAKGDGGKGDEAPVLAQACDAEFGGDEGGIDAEEEAVG